VIDIEVETDALVLVQALKGNQYDIAANGVLFKEIKSLSMLNFNSCSFSFCPRVCNNVANTLASFGAKLVHLPQAVWPGDVRGVL
jgi:hypothetical protein